MRVAVPVIILMLLIPNSACKMDSDVLAEYSSGSITRGAFNQWLSDNPATVKAIQTNRPLMIEKLNELFRQRMAVREAKKAGLDKQADFLELFEIEKNRLLHEMAKEVFATAKLDFSEPVIALKMIYIKVDRFRQEKNRTAPLPKAEIDSAYQRATDKANDIIKKLKTGEKFEDCVQRYSDDDISKKKGGSIGYITADMQHEDFSKAAFSLLKEDQITETPVVVNDIMARGSKNGVYILKLTDRFVLNNNNLDDFFANKFKTGCSKCFKDKIKKKIVDFAITKHIDDLKKQKKIEENLARAISTNPADILFTIDSLSYTVADLNRRIAIIRKDYYYKYFEEMLISDNERKRIAKEKFDYELFQRLPQVYSIMSDQKFAARIARLHDTVLAAAFLTSLGSKQVSLTDEEIRKEYDTNKAVRYYRYVPVPRSTTGRQVIDSFDEAKPKIIKFLLRHKTNTVQMSWKNDIMKHNSFTIIDSRL